MPCAITHFHRETLRRLGRERCGAIAVQMALAITVLLGFAGVGVDVAVWEVSRRDMQGAVDHAAYSAAITAGGGTKATTSAKGITAQMGFVDGQNGVTVAVNNPPTQGGYTSDTQAWEVIINKPQPMWFAGVFLSSAPVATARAVAVRQGGGRPCLVALEATKKEAVLMNSDGDIDLIDCSAWIESNGEAPALRTNSGGDIAVASSQKICAHSYEGGGYNITPATTCASLGNSDPLNGVTLPTPGACTGANTDKTYVDNTTISPGTYCKKLEINAGKTLTLQPGVYVLRGANLKVNSGSTLKQAAGGSGVFIYFTYDSSYGHSLLNVNSDSIMDLAAMSSGTYKGVLLYSAANNGTDKDQIFNSQSTGQLKGTVYFPKSRIVLNSFGLVNASCGSWIGNSYFLNSNSQLNLTMGDSASCGFDLTQVGGGGSYALVE
jgi:hypothetical protein